MSRKPFFVVVAVVVLCLVTIGRSESRTDPQSTEAVSSSTEPLVVALSVSRTISEAAEAVDEAVSFLEEVATTTTTTTTTTVPPTTTTMPPPTTTTTTTAAPPPPVADDSTVMAAIRAHFGDSDHLLNQAMAIADCESEYNPRAVSDTNDHGLFQIHAGSGRWPRGWQDEFARITGAPFFDGVYNPNLNAQFARYLYNSRGGWGDWSCRYVL